MHAEKVNVSTAYAHYLQRKKHSREAPYNVLVFTVNFHSVYTTYKNIKKKSIWDDIIMHTTVVVHTTFTRE